MIRRIESTDVKRAMEQVKEELGPDALIFSTRTWRRDQSFGVLGREMVEVIACEKRDLFEASLPETLFALYYELLEEGVDEAIVKSLIRAMKERAPKEVIKDERALRMGLGELMMKIMPPVLPVKKGKRVMALVGPTGVGKTTTALKLAVTEIIAGRRAVIITSDAERVGAAEHLLLCGKAAGVPVEVAMNRREIQRAMERHGDCPLILLDTPGRNYMLNGWTAELQELLPPLPTLEVHLVLAASTRDAELSKLIRRFLSLPLTALIFSKLDESITFGTIFNQTVRFGMPLSYFTTGQRVPEDIEKATKIRLVDLILKLSQEGWR